jgi:hypothetical protein
LVEGEEFVKANELVEEMYYSDSEPTSLCPFSQHTMEALLILGINNLNINHSGATFRNLKLLLLEM